MNETLTQEQRLAILIETFKGESLQYKQIVTPKDTEGKRRMLRSLMNVRMPATLPPEILQIQNEYLSARLKEKGIVTAEMIPTAKGAFGSARKFADTLSLWQGDITRLAVDAIVNAANSQMLGCFIPMHTCIDNTIHTFAGVQLREECNRQMERLRAEFGRDYEQPTAVPILTDAYNLPAKKVIHIVGPVVQYDLTEKLEADLSDCYKNTLDMCLANGLKSVAFCCISTGVFRFPNKRAAEIAVVAVERWLAEHPGGMERIIFNVFKDEDRKYYEELIH